MKLFPTMSIIYRTRHWTENLLPVKSFVLGFAVKLLFGQFFQEQTSQWSDNRSKASKAAWNPLPAPPAKVRNRRSVALPLRLCFPRRRRQNLPRRRNTSMRRLISGTRRPPPTSSTGRRLRSRGPDSRRESRRPSCSSRVPMPHRRDPSPAAGGSSLSAPGIIPHPLPPPLPALHLERGMGSELLPILHPASLPPTLPLPLATHRLRPLACPSLPPTGSEGKCTLFTVHLTQ